jgi:hypothetical protein
MALLRHLGGSVRSRLRPIPAVICEAGGAAPAVAVNGMPKGSETPHGYTRYILGPSRFA